MKTSERLDQNIKWNCVLYSFNSRSLLSLLIKWIKDTAHSSFFLSGYEKERKRQMKWKEGNGMNEEKGSTLLFLSFWPFSPFSPLVTWVLGEEGNERKKKKWSETKRTERASFPYHYLCSFFHFSSLLFFHSVLTVHLIPFLFLLSLSIQFNKGKEEKNERTHALFNWMKEERETGTWGERPSAQGLIVRPLASS